MAEFDLTIFWWVFGFVILVVVIVIGYGFITLWRLSRQNKKGKNERER